MRVETSLDLRGLFHAILTCVTAGSGLGFNRAALFLADDDETRLSAAMAIGPATPEEAHATWARLASEDKSLDELLFKGPGEEGNSGFQTLVEGLVIPLGAAAATGKDKGSPVNAPDNPLLNAYRSRRIVTITDPASLRDLPAPLREVFNGTEVVCVPLMAKERSVGLIIADNVFTGQPIGRERIQLLQLLALLAGLALDNARIYRQIERQAKQLSETLDQLKAAQDQVIHSERLATVGAVVARVSHEIRNPLTTIGGFARTLGAHPDDTDRVARNANIIVDEVEKLEALLKEMLDFTSPRPPALEPTDLNGLLGALATVHRDDLTERNVSLALELAPGLPRVLTDRNQMHRVFLNLWQNALQAMEESPVGHRNKLIVQTWPDGATVKIAFTDTGVGISPDVLPNIFTPFFTTKQRGTGLGLAVAKKIIDDHRGSIHVLSEQGAGTTIVVVLPVAGGRPCPES